jgi:hypothetical protein
VTAYFQREEGFDGLVLCVDEGSQSVRDRLTWGEAADLFNVLSPELARKAAGLDSALPVGSPR